MIETPNNKLSDPKVDELVEKLNNVNHITGIESIIDMCRSAAIYIQNAEKLRYEVKNKSDWFEYWLQTRF